MTLAVAGATRRSEISSARAMWAIRSSSPPPKSSTATRRPERLLNSRGEMSFGGVPGHDHLDVDLLFLETPEDFAGLVDADRGRYAQSDRFHGAPYPLRKPARMRRTSFALAARRVRRQTTIAASSSAASFRSSLMMTWSKRAQARASFRAVSSRPAIARGLSSPRRTSRSRRASKLGGRMKVKTAFGSLSRTCRAPWTSMSRIRSPAPPFFSSFREVP